MAKGSSSILQIVALGGLGWFGYNAYKKYALHQAHAGAANLKIRINGFHADTEGVTMNIDVQNPNTQNLDIQSFVGQMSVDGKNVGDIKMFGDYNVKGNSEMKIPLIVKPSMSIFSAAMSSMKKGISRLSFSGTVNVNNTPIPLTINYTV